MSLFHPLKLLFSRKIDAAINVSVCNEIPNVLPTALNNKLIFSSYRSFVR